MSRLASEPALRMHLLALVASGAVATDGELEAFFAATFYGRTLPLRELHSKIAQVRRFLEENELLAAGSTLGATRFGSLTSQLYLDPLSAIVLRGVLERAPIGVGAFPLLAAVAATPDLSPLFLRRGEEADLIARFSDEAAELLVQPQEPPIDLDLDAFLATLKTATVLEAWIAETPILEITERHGIGAGDVRATGSRTPTGSCSRSGASRPFFSVGSAARSMTWRCASATACARNSSTWCASAGSAGCGPASWSAPASRTARRCATPRSIGSSRPCDRAGSPRWSSPSSIREHPVGRPRPRDPRIPRRPRGDGARERSRSSRWTRRRDPFVDRRQHAEDGTGPPAPARPDLPSHVARPLQADEPAPERRRREGPEPLLVGQFRLETADVPERRREPLTGRADRADDAGLDRHVRAPLPSGFAETADPEQLPSQKVDRTAGAEPVLDGAREHPTDQRGRGRAAARPLGAVVHDRAQHRLGVGRQLDERPHRIARLDPCDRGRESVRRSRHDRPDPRQPALALGEEPVRVSEGAQHRAQVRTADSHVIEHEDGGAAVPTKSAEHTG